MGKFARRRRHRSAPRVEALEDRRLLSGYSPAQVRAAYGFDRVAFRSPSGATVAGDGAGQTIAIVAAFHNPNLLADLKVFDQAFGLPTADVRIVNLAGDATEATWALESAMDVQWAHALAPAATIVLVEARSDSGDDVLDAVEVARNLADATVVSMSFGFSETPAQHGYDHRFTTPAGHVGVTFVAAAGDHGPTGGATFPASSSNVVGVGGASLVLDAAGNPVSEAVWSRSAGGPGRYSSRPSYQASLVAGPRRSTPDVAFLGDPTTGVAVYHAPPGASAGEWRTAGGTSLGAPAWAAIVAIANQGRALRGAPSLDGPSQTLPALYSLAGSAAFRSVARPAGSASPGLGVPEVSILAPALAAADAFTTADHAPTHPRQSPRRRPPTVPSRAPLAPRRVGPGRFLRPRGATATVEFRQDRLLTR